MVYVISSFPVATGKTKEAHEFLQKQGEYMKKAFGVRYVRLQPVTAGAGEANRILSIATFESLAAWGDFQQKALEDSKRNALVAESSEKQIFAMEGFTRTVYTTI